jgi:multidrug efflux system membrane fusion protein
MHHRFRWLIFVAAVILALSSGEGCERRPKRIAPAQTLVVPVSRPVKRNVTEFADYPGTTAAVQLVDVRARVTGYLVRMPFREGAEVKGPQDPRVVATTTLGMLGSAHHLGPISAASSLHPASGEGELLFEIDPRPYQALYDRALSEVVHSETRLALAKADYARAMELAKTPGAISQQELERYQAAQNERQAGVLESKANLDVARLNLGFCRVTAPISGQVSRYYITLGNVANQDQTVLTTIVSQDPIYVNFNVDQPTFDRIKDAINAGQIKSELDAANMPVYLGLQNAEGYPHAGMVNFVNNQVSTSTGTITMRGVFPNPKSARGVRPLTPGMFVRIRLPLGSPRSALLVADKAVGMDQGLRYLYVLDAENRVIYRRVHAGPLQEDGLRVIDDGLQPDDRVVVSLLQQVRPNLVVEPELVPMPTTEPEKPAPAPPAKVTAEKGPVVK